MESPKTEMNTVGKFLEAIEEASKDTHTVTQFFGMTVPQNRERTVTVKLQRGTEEITVTIKKLMSVEEAIATLTEWNEVFHHRW